MTIEEFIEARVAEDEAYAEESGGGEWGSSDDSVNTERETIYTLHHANHIARNDPARALRQAAAVRRILRRYAEAERDSLLSERDSGYAAGMYGALESLAAIWPDHPDYRSERSA